MGSFAQGALIEQRTSVTNSGGTTNLTLDSTTIQRFTGSNTQTAVLPDATTLIGGRYFEIENESDKNVTVNYFGGTFAVYIASGTQRSFQLHTNSVSAGDWVIGNQVDLEGPLALHATRPAAGSLLNITSSQVYSGSGNLLSTPPIDDIINIYTDTSIDFSWISATGGITGGTVLTQNATFTRPVVVSGQYVRIVFTYLSTSNSLNTKWSTSSLTQGGLDNPGLLFASIDGLPIGYIDLISLGSYRFKTASSSGVVSLIENKDIVKFAAGAGTGGAGDKSFRFQSITGSLLTVKAGSIILNDGRELYTPTDFTIDLSAVASVDGDYYGYIDLTQIPLTPTYFNGRKFYQITASQFIFTTSSPDNTSVNLSRYLPIGTVERTAGVWQNQQTTSLRRHDNIVLGVDASLEFSQAYTTVGALGGLSQIKAGHILDSNSFQSSIPTAYTSWYGLTNVNDSSTNGRNLTANGSPVFTDPDLFGLPTCFAPDGANDYLSSTNTFFKGEIATINQVTQNNNLTGLVVNAPSSAIWVNLGSSFTASVTAPLTTVQFYLSVGSISTGTVEARLHSVSGGYPNALLATSTAINASSLPAPAGSPAWVTFTFPSPVTLISGTTYIVSYYTADGRNVRMYNNGTDVYVGGVKIYGDGTTANFIPYPLEDTPFIATQYQPTITDFAFGVWAEADNYSAASIQALVSTWGSAGNKSFKLQLNNGSLEFVTSADGTAETTTTIYDATTLSGWNNFIVSCISGVYYFYVNSNFILSTALTRYSPASVTFNLGAAVGANFFAGSLDEFFFITGSSADQDTVNKIWSTKIAHNRNLLPTNQKWHGLVSYGDIEREFNDFTVDVTPNILYADFSRHLSTSKIALKMLNTGTIGISKPVKARTLQLTASDLDALMPLTHWLYDVPFLRLQVDDGSSQYRSYDDASYFKADNTQIYSTGTTLSSIVGASTNVRFTYSIGGESISSRTLGKYIIVGNVPDADFIDLWAALSATSTVDGSRLLVVTDQTLSSAVTIAHTNIYIEFLPGVKITSTVAIGTAINFSGSGISTNNITVLLNSNVDGLLFSASNTAHNNLVVKVAGNVTNVFTFGVLSSNNQVEGNIQISGGSFTVPVLNNSAAINNSWSISTATSLYNGQLYGNSWGTTGGSNMFNINGYGRIYSPTQSILPAGTTSFDCSVSHIFYKTGGTATFTINNLVEGQTINFVIASTGSAYTITWAGQTFRWKSGIPPIPTPTASSYDVYTFIKIGGVAYGASLLGMS